MFYILYIDIFMKLSFNNLEFYAMFSSKDFEMGNWFLDWYQHLWYELVTD